MPEDGDGNIRADVVNYLKHFKERQPAAPETHWLTISQAAIEVGGLDIEAESLRGKETFGSHTQTIVEARIQPLVVHLREVIQAELKKSSDEFYPLITLSNGAEILVKRGANGEPQLLDSELPLWRDWLLEQAYTKGQTSSARTTWP